MNQKGSRGQSASGRTTDITALLVIVGAAFAASALVVWLASATGLEIWAVVLLALMLVFIVLALAD